MAAITTTVGNICAGGNHVTLTVQAGARSVSQRVERDWIFDSVTDDELLAFGRICCKLVRSDKTGAQALAALQAGYTVTG